MMTATKTHREMCQEDWMISGRGGLTCFQNSTTKEVETAFGKNLLIQLKNCFFLKDLFSETVRQSCCSDECWMLEVWLVHSWLCCKACNELWASLRLINTLVVLSVLLLNLENLFFLYIHLSIHLTTYPTVVMGEVPPVLVIVACKKIPIFPV